MTEHSIALEERNGLARPDNLKNATFTFAAGPQQLVEGLSLPGPILQVRTNTETLFVDDRDAGQDLSIGSVRARTIAHAEAVAMLKTHLAATMAKDDARSNLETARLSLGTAAVVSPTIAAQLLPGREEANRRWLAQRGLLRKRPNLPDVVVMSDIIDALREGSPERTTPVSANSRHTLRRARIA